MERIDYFGFIDNNTPSAFGLYYELYYLDEKLDSKTKQSINEKGIFLYYSIGPGSIGKNIRLNTDKEIKRLIVIDKTLTHDLLKLDHTEIAAEILHEIGHILNKEPKGKENETEFYADDFVRKNGLGFQLCSGLRKYLSVIETYTEKTQKSFFYDMDKQLQILNNIKDRIDRINGHTEPLNGEIAQ